jgi:hypothetical protein
MNRARSPVCRADLRDLFQQFPELRNANTPRSDDEIPNQSKSIAAATAPVANSFLFNAVLHFVRGGDLVNPYQRRLIIVRIVILLLVGLAFLIARIARSQ